MRVHSRRRPRAATLTSQEVTFAPTASVAESLAVNAPALTRPRRLRILLAIGLLVLRRASLASYRAARLGANAVTVRSRVAGPDHIRRSCASRWRDYRRERRLSHPHESRQPTGQRQTLRGTRRARGCARCRAGDDHPRSRRRLCSLQVCGEKRSRRGAGVKPSPRPGGSGPTGVYAVVTRIPAQARPRTRPPAPRGRGPGVAAGRR
jgi:hypothetical protein